MLSFQRWQIIATFILCIVIIPLILLPNFFTKDELAKMPSFVPKTQIQLGLDLQGGAHLVYEADFKTYYSERLAILKNDIRSVLRPRGEDRKAEDGNEKKLIGFRNIVIKDDSLKFTIVDEKDVDEIKKRLETLVQPVDNSLFNASQARNYEIVYNKDKREFSMVMSKEEKVARGRIVMENVMEVMRRRIDAFGTREPSIFIQGKDRIVLQVPGEKDVDRLKSEVGKTAKMSFHMVNTDLTDSLSADAPVPNRYKRLPYIEKEDNTPIPNEQDESRNILPERTMIVEELAALDGENLSDTGTQFDDMGRSVVTFKLDNTGTRKFADITSTHIGKPFAIVLDGKIITAPVIQTPITGGSGQISGQFTPQSAASLALLLRSGALPVPLKVVEERTIGPELGAESINSGKNALLFSFLLVSTFMILYYGRMGVYATIALLVNTLLIFACLSLLGATLTLPGIAGVVLGIGMAVDANVLINERVREELRNGKKLIQSLDEGYKFAWATILDSHVTGLVSAIIMFMLGVGPIRGFAVTLMLGVAGSLFTSVFLTRMMVAIWVKRKRPQTLTLGLSGA